MTIDWEKQFPIANINRADLTEFGFSDEQITTLFTDAVMTEIAKQMEGLYHLHADFWGDFKLVIEAVLNRSLPEAKVKVWLNGQPERSDP